MTTPTTMHAIAIDHFGGPEQLTLHELPVPTPGLNGVLIKVQVAGVGGWDATERSGAMVQITPDAVETFPRILGADGAGTVVATRATRALVGLTPTGYAPRSSLGWTEPRPL